MPPRKRRQALQGDQDKLAHNRETHPLFDTDRFRRHLEAAYTTMWERYRRGERPSGFGVAALQ
jgi:predicted O-linked N-acetylglucosamine transferase (SPINDLY family)